MIAGETEGSGARQPAANLASVQAPVAPTPAAVTHPLDAHAVRAPASGVSGPKRPAGSAGHPAWLRLADAGQRSLRQPLPITLDVVVGGAVAAVLSGSPGAAAVAAAVLLVTGLLFGVWKRRSSVQAQGVGWYVRRIIPGSLMAAAAVKLYPGVSDRSAFAVAVGLFLCLAWVKLLLWVVVATARRRGLGLIRALVIGPERLVAGAEYRIHLYPEAGLVCAHSHVCSPGRTGTAAQSLELIEKLLADHAIDHVVCTSGDTGTDHVVRDIVRLAPRAVDVTVVQSVPRDGVPLTRLGDLAVICLARPSWGTETFKRVFDVVGASLLIGLLGPLLVMTGLAIRLGDPGPAIFRQRRTGLRNRTFTILKFRSMVQNAESLKVDLLHRNVADGLLFKAADDPRITSVGSFIRRFSIDELPQLMNVLKGDMSLVGPRPLPSEFSENDLFARVRHAVLPGITGLWQVNGANALSYDDMIDLDCAYVASQSLGFDLKILLQTVPAVLVRHDPY
jgi:lipopolysaccharide/colanic/teichoic acid biosynthesis glycosyltransferase